MGRLIIEVQADVSKSMYTCKILSANMGFGSANIGRYISSLYFRYKMLCIKCNVFYIYIKYVSLVKISSHTERHTY